MFAKMKNFITNPPPVLDIRDQKHRHVKHLQYRPHLIMAAKYHDFVAVRAQILQIIHCHPG